MTFQTDQTHVLYDDSRNKMLHHTIIISIKDTLKILEHLRP